MSFRLIVGLGNIGADYANTRHNLGFELIDQIATKYKITFQLEKKFFAKIAKLIINDDKHKQHEIYFLKPQTYMNLSGQAVQAFCHFYKIVDTQEILVIHDELDFVPGIIKLKFASGSAGHNGLRSITQVIGSNYWRLRIGIGKPQYKEQIADYVVKPPNGAQRQEIDFAVQKFLTILPLVLAGDIHDAQKDLHSV